MLYKRRLLELIKYRVACGDNEQIGERYATLLPHLSIGVLLASVNTTEDQSARTLLRRRRRNDYSLVLMQARNAYAVTSGPEPLVSTHNFKVIVDYLLTGSLNHK